MSYTGNAMQAIPRARQALRLSPCDKYRFYYLACLALAHYSGGDYDGAVNGGASRCARMRRSRRRCAISRRRLPAAVT